MKLLQPLCIGALTASIACACSEHQTIRNVEDPTVYVNPFIGAADNGHTYPGATRPFGMVQPSPVTGAVGWQYCAEYVNGDSTIWGFSQTHLSGTGCMDLGNILVMPLTGEHIREWDAYRSSFDKSSETACPGYYAVTLDDAGVRAELTATSRVALHRYTFETPENAAVLIDLQHGPTWNEKQYHRQVLECETEWINDSTLTGHVVNSVWIKQPYWFALQFNRPVSSVDNLPMAEDEKGQRIVAGFDLAKGDRLLMKAALSTVSTEGALANIAAELPGWDFDAVATEAHDEWRDLLSRIDMEGTDDQKKNLYTSLYHAYVQPNRISDADGRYRNAADSVVKATGDGFYSTFSLWDTYRAAHPLYTILNPERVDGFVNSLIEQSEVHGYIPLWALWGRDTECMVGNHGVPVIAEAFRKGFKGFDAERAYDAVRRTQTVPHGPKSPWDIYLKYGYFPSDLIEKESVSSTLETTYDDYAAADMARRMGKTDDAEMFAARADYYKNLFDTTTLFMRPRLSDGSWKGPFNPSAIGHAESVGGDYTEGNAWQYTWHVQHDIDGLMDLFPDRETFVQRLDSLFTIELITDASDVTGLIGQYAHGNEPSHHVAYLYTLAGRPDRTEELIREIFDTQYHPYPEGLCGNDDCGQMSAWYIFSAMGFYPVDPVSGNYIIGAPQMPRITIATPSGNDFTVIAENISEDNKYVESVSLNGKPLDRNYLTHEEIIAGGELRFVMSATPAVR
ncbi:MAG: GH92 family glycosyl hydrolase [Muribaculaceae bacterium]|nr:GH92 family glycosyl hydrolase [Muribaculaceae bacterium]